MMDRQDWADVLRSRGHRVTAQRLAIMGALAAATHPTADGIHEFLRDSEPTLNLSTVYRNLAVLEQAGLVTHAHIGSGAPVYHLAEEAPHVHLSCLRCGSVTSVGSQVAADFGARVAEETGFRLDAAHSAVYGVCAACAADPA